MNLPSLVRKHYDICHELTSVTLTPKPAVITLERTQFLRVNTISYSIEKAILRIADQGGQCERASSGRTDRHRGQLAGRNASNQSARAAGSDLKTMMATGSK